MLNAYATKILATFVFVCFAPYVTFAHAQDTNGAVVQNRVAAPSNTKPELDVALPQGQLLGRTRLSIWGFKVYDASLWAATGFRAQNYAEHPLALELAYLRDFEATAIAKRSLEEMRRSASISPTQEAQWTAQMLRAIPNVKKGDRILGVYYPGQGATFWFNGKQYGEIKDAEFARLFFGIWLSPKTSEPAMREALLAGARS